MKTLKTISLLAVLLSSPLYASIFWNQEAVDSGYELPPTFGFSIIGAIDHEGVSAANLYVGSKNPVIAPVMKNIGFEVTNIDVKVKTKLMRFDAWIFPFLNVYAVAGRTDGTAKVDTEVKKWDEIAAQEFGGLDQLKEFGLEKNMKFNSEFGGNTYGGGLVLAGGYKDFFTVINYTYVTTKLDMLTGSVMAQTLSATAGYKIFPNLKVWTGALYENIDQRVSGPIPSAMLPEKTKEQVGEGATFTVHARTTHPVNPVIGAQYTFMDKVDVTLEGTIGNRQAATLMLSYRF